MLLMVLAVLFGSDLYAQYARSQRWAIGLGSGLSLFTDACPNCQKDFRVKQNFKSAAEVEYRISRRFSATANLQWTRQVRNQLSRQLFINSGGITNIQRFRTSERADFGTVVLGGVVQIPWRNWEFRAGVGGMFVRGAMRLRVFQRDAESTAFRFKPNYGLGYQLFLGSHYWLTNRLGIDLRVVRDHYSYLSNSPWLTTNGTNQAGNIELRPRIEWRPIKLIFLQIGVKCRIG